MKRKIIIDTDPGIDDAMAIMLAVKSGKFNIKALTTVCGNSSIENTTKNACYILKILNTKNIPIYSGESKPFQKVLIKAIVHEKDGLGGISPNNKLILTNNAVDKIVEIVKDNPFEITIIALGPLTNIAKAIIKNPNVMNKIKEVVIMGGAINVPGNKNRVAEFNIFVDPEAADIVFKFPINKILVPLDACNDVKLLLEDFKKIKDSILRVELLKMVESYIDKIEKVEGVKAAIMYDPLTVYYLLNPKAAKTYKCNIEIETKGELTRGMTVADLREKPQEPSNIVVVEFIEPRMFKDDFISILNI